MDKIASAASIQNNNNTGGEKKLCLFESLHGTVLPNDKSIEELFLKKMQDYEFFDGCSIILEYVENNKTELESLEPYQTVLTKT